MAVAQAPVIEAQLLAAGASGDTEVVIVEKAGRPGSRTVSTSLAALSADIKRSGISNPAIIFVRWPKAAASRANEVDTDRHALVAI